MTPQPPVKRRHWPLIVGGLLLLVMLACGYVYYNPFWLIDRGVSTYMRAHAVTSSHVDVEGNRIHYLEAKPPTGSPDRSIVLVHGLGARATDWAPLIPTLAANGYHVYAIDLLGYGDSPKPANGDFSLTGEERILLGFMRTLHLQNADVAGWSMGGWISMLLTLDHPEVVRRLLLFDSAGLYFDPDFSSSLFAPSDRAGLERLIARIEPDRPRLKLPAFAVSGMLRRLQANRWIVERSFRSMISGRQVLDFRLSRLHAPVLIVWGTEDKLTPFTQAEQLHTSLPQSILVGLRGCGHLAAAECAPQVLPEVVRFLKAEPPLPASRVLLDGPTRARKL